ncbi:MAG TPA: hypothetical protein VE890_13810 [Thermoguttaceae bacterium]|nr:hypothetical protein [Thermoguttaceae bacterium]
MTDNPAEVYSLARELIAACEASGHNDVAKQIDEALHAGSSALEILGAIRTAFIDHRAVLNLFVDSGQLDSAIAFVDAAFGRG